MVSFRQSTAAAAFLTLAPLFWAGNFVVARALHADMPPVELAFWRWAIALAALAPFAWPGLWQYRRVIIRHWRYVVSLGATGIAGFSTLLYAALTSTSSMNALIFFAMSPALITPISWALLRERLARRQALGTLCSFAGAVLIITQGDPVAVVRNGFNPGDLVMLIAAPVWALYTVLLKQRPPTLPQLPALTASIGAGIVLLSPIYLWRVAAGEPVTPTSATVLGLLYIAICASALAFACWSRGIELVGPNRAGAYLHLTPVFGAILAFLLLDERLATYHMFGASLVGAGVLLANLTSREPHGRPIAIKSNPAE
jgi:drug/metabolite transporter (DMT)-like permease